MPLLKDPILNLPRRPTRNCCMIRRSCSVMVTSGRSKLQRTCWVSICIARVYFVDRWAEMRVSMEWNCTMIEVDWLWLEILAVQLNWCLVRILNHHITALWTFSKPVATRVLRLIFEVPHLDILNLTNAFMKTTVRRRQDTCNYLIDRSRLKIRYKISTLSKPVDAMKISTQYKNQSMP